MLVQAIHEASQSAHVVVLATLDPTNFGVTGESYYAEMVCESRRQRRLVDGQLTDWIVVRNRPSNLGSCNKKLVGEGLTELSKCTGIRCVDGFAECVVYREFFQRGLTVFDDFDATMLGMRPNISHLTAREGVIALINALHLPLSENSKRRADTRTEWYSIVNQALQVHDVIGYCLTAVASAFRTSPCKRGPRAGFLTSAFAGVSG